jgi:hypothetical protein
LLIIEWAEEKRHHDRFKHQEVPDAVTFFVDSAADGAGSFYNG